jgi:hypothetical protein
MSLFYGLNNNFIIFDGILSYIFGLLKNKLYICITMSSGFKFKRFEARIFMSITMGLTALQKE